MPQPIDWKAVHAEALDIFVRYLQIRSVNPPGNEKPAARFLGALIEAEGIPMEYIEIAPEREAIVARLKGDGSKGALMLCNHTDVVPVEEAYWDVPPFEGVVKDGSIWGRGAVDMKGAGVMQLIAFLLLARHKTPLARDIVFLGTPDEEAGSFLGMRWLCEHRPDVVDVEYEISEGGMGLGSYLGEDARIMPVAVAEKFACRLKLTSVGKPGHASRPHRDNSAVHLARAIVRLADWEREPVFTPITREHFARLQAAGKIPPGPIEEVVPAVAEEHPGVRAMLINTLNVTMVNAGIKINVIPALSEAGVDCRLLPGQDPEEWRQQVIARIDDPRVKVEFHSESFKETPQSSWETELFSVIQDVVKEALEDCVVLPGMTVGATDNRFLRDRGVPAYGFIPVLLSPEEATGFHGNNERMTVENFNLGCELTYEVVRRFCAAS